MQHGAVEGVTATTAITTLRKVKKKIISLTVILMNQPYLICRIRLLKGVNAIIRMRNQRINSLIYSARLSKTTITTPTPKKTWNKGTS